jgi:hypothetical protein
MASLEPKWIPNPARARALLDAKLAPRRDSRAWMMAAVTAAVAITMVAIPESRALAQDLWFRVLLHRVDVVRVDLSRLPLDTKITTNGASQVVQSVEEAEQKAGFRPILPPLDVLADTPEFAITGPISVRQTVHVRKLRPPCRRLAQET